MGLILDLAVVAIAAVVVVSLALLAWTLAVTAVGSVRSSRRTIGELRASIAEAEDRLAKSSARFRASLERLDDWTDARAGRAERVTGEQTHT